MVYRPATCRPKPPSCGRGPRFRERELVGANPLDPQDVGRFLVESFNPTRTMLGRAQMDQLKADLLSAHADGVVWKFVLVPEPIQNLGVVGAADRFEGYAAERTEILSFVAANQITNVVFVAADIHGTLVNNLTYQLGPFQPQIQTAAWEISTGSVAFDAPFGPTVVEIAAGLGFLTPQQVAFYESLPREGKDAFVRTMVDQQIQPLGYDAVGLEGSGVPAELLEGSYANLHTFGWSQFEIDPTSFALTVTTYGIDPYTREELESDPGAIVDREPFVVGRFRVQAAPEGGQPSEVDSPLPPFSLQVTPMPALDRAILRYSVPSGVGIDLSVIDISGRTIRRLAVGDPQAGEVTWDLADEAGRLVPAGVYFAQLRVGDRVATERMVIAR
ncbi:MAG: alkaline phosphatase D family protein [Candidatus Eisenbacteria bacterium]|nr:alkaline phosphatase D family protein [Candidatus Eisenbacteria bacterium]